MPKLIVITEDTAIRGALAGIDSVECVIGNPRDLFSVPADSYLVPLSLGARWGADLKRRYTVERLEPGEADLPQYVFCGMGLDPEELQTPRHTTMLLNRLHAAVEATSNVLTVATSDRFLGLDSVPASLVRSLVTSGWRRQPSNDDDGPGVRVVRPLSFSDAPEIADPYKLGMPIIVDLSTTQRSHTKRLIDFSSGLTYGDGGTMRPVGSDTFLLTPNPDRMRDKAPVDATLRQTAGPEVMEGL